MTETSDDKQSEEGGPSPSSSFVPKSILRHRDEENGGMLDTESISSRMSKSQPQQREMNYDVEVTDLYRAVQNKQWSDCITLANSIPQGAVEAATWIFRLEPDRKFLRWRMLPLHAAAIFGAPETVVEALLRAFPNGASCVDDQGMLALHLVARHGSSVETVRLLRAANPQSVSTQDRKGRVPVALARVSTYNDDGKQALIAALEEPFDDVDVVPKEPSSTSSEEEIRKLREELETEKKAFQEAHEAELARRVKEVEDIKKKELSERAQEIMDLQREVQSWEEKHDELTLDLEKKETEWESEKRQKDTLVVSNKQEFERDIENWKTKYFNLEKEQEKKQLEWEKEKKKGNTETKVDMEELERDVATWKAKYSEMVKVHQTKELQWEKDRQMTGDETIVALEDRVKGLEKQLEEERESQEKETAIKEQTIEQVKKLQQELIQTNQRVEKMQKDQTALEEERVNLQGQIKARDASAAEEREKYHNLQHQLGEARASLVEITEAKESMVLDVQARDSTLAEEGQKLRVHIASLQSVLEGANQDNENLRKDMERCDAELQQRSDQMESLKNRLQEVLRVNEALRMDLTDRDGQITNRKEEINQLQTRLDETAEESRSLKKQLKHHDRIFEEKYVNLRTEIATARASIAVTESQNSQVQQLNRDLHRKVDQLEDRIVELTSSLEERCNTVTSLTVLKGRFETRIEKLKNALLGLLDRQRVLIANHAEPVAERLVNLEIRQSGLMDAWKRQSGRMDMLERRNHEMKEKLVAQAELLSDLGNEHVETERNLSQQTGDLLKEQGLHSDWVKEMKELQQDMVAMTTLFEQQPGLE